MPKKKEVKPREKWADDHALSSVREKLKKRALLNMEHAKVSDTSNRAISVHVVRECDLRATLEEKATQVHRFAKWTAFVNRAGTLIHILPMEGDFHIRLPLYGRSIKNDSDHHIERLVHHYADGRLV